MMKKLKNLLIGYDKPIKTALKRLDEEGRKVIFVSNEEEKLYGALTDGDIRRWILKTGGIEGSVNDICSKDPVYLQEDYSIDKVKDLMVTRKIEAIPIIDNRRKIVKILFWDDIFKEKKKEVTKIDLPVVIMAGGKGVRLDPFTRVLPKSLIPIGDKTIIEMIMDEYAKFGMKDFYISINHKSKMIRAYFEEHNSDYNFKFVEENIPMGTIGSLSFLKDNIKNPFFVANCDVIIKTDYSDIYSLHKKNKNAMTLVTSMQHHTIPYGVCETENSGKLKNIKEKPEFDFLVNTGMYLMNPEIIELIPQNRSFDIIELINLLKKKKYNIGIYPVSEKSWLDIGQWGEYKKTLKKFTE
jgi:dTDP-glucose pyrophosphorylase